MASASLRKEMATLRKSLAELCPQTTPLLERLREDPANLLLLADFFPDPWQARVLRSCSPRKLLNCSRQSGKSLAAAALALREALLSRSEERRVGKECRSRWS